MQTSKWNILIVDDHILMRDALVSLINKFDGMVIKGAAANGKELIDLLGRSSIIDLIILDLNMPIMDGYATAEWLRENYPSVKILVLTMYDSDVALIRLLQTGVRGFLKKDISPADLKLAIASVLEYGYYYSNDTSEKLASFFLKDKTGSAKYEKGMLTEREIEFLKLVTSDYTYKEIASHLNMSARAIDNYRDILFEKLDVKSRVGLAIYALKNGIVVF